MRTLLGWTSPPCAPLTGSRALQRHTQPPPRDEPNRNLRTRGRRGRDESAPPAVTVSGQDLVDVEFRLLAADRSLLVLAREHLADQAEREELEADDDQEHAERQQRALADRVAESLDDGQVDEDRDSEQAEDETESAEQMQRPVPVAADEGNGQQIQESADVALDAVARATVLARAVVDGQLGDPKAWVLGE